MSRIVKMQVQGVRSFGPEDEDRQQVEFYTPLTLILGPNGTGKTTIIECLKYMTTGDMPPGGNNAAFIHDPKIANEQRVRGQVKLQFYDVKGANCIATRSMEVTQQLKKSTFKTLDGVLRKMKADGEPVDITSRHTDMNRELPALLGVSKAILENVIFCHQEDSNWPLAEGKVVKGKFDDIFASTRYVKALDTIRKIRMEKQGTIKLYQNDIKYLRANKEKASEIRGDLKQKEASCLATKDRVQKIKAELEPISRKLETINAKESNMWDLQSKIDGLKYKKKESLKSQEELRKNIENLFKGSTRELEQQIQDFNEKVKERQEELDKLKQELREVDERLDRLSQDKASILMEHGKLEQEAKQHEDNVKKRDDSVRKGAAKYEFSGFRGKITEDDIKDFISKLDQKSKEYMEIINKNRAEFEEKEKGIQNKLDKARNEKTKMETELKIKKETMDKNLKEIRRISQELNRVDESAHRLHAITTDLRQAETDLADAEKAVDVGKLNGEVNKLNKEKAALDSRLKLLDAELNQLHKDSEVHTQLGIFKKDKTTKQDQIRKLRAKNEDTVTQILGALEMPTENLDRTMQKYLREVTASVTTITTEVEAKKIALSKLETERKHVLDQLKKREGELGKQKEQLFVVVSDINKFDDTVAETKLAIRKKEDIRGLLQGTEKVLRNYIEKLHRDDAPCPLCHRQFDEADEITGLIDELEEKLEQLPSKLQEEDKAIRELQKKYEEMQQLTHVRTNVIDLENKEIPTLKSRQDSIEEQISALKTEISEMSSDLTKKKENESTARRLLPDMANIDRLTNEVKDLDRKVSQQTSKLTGGGSDRTIKEVNDERQDIQKDLETKNSDIEHKRRKIMDHTDSKNKLITEVQELKNQKLEIEKDVQQRQKLEENKETLQDQNDVLCVEIQEAEDAMGPIKEEIERLLGEKNVIIREKDTAYDQDKEKFTQIKNFTKEVNTMDETIRSYVQRGRDKLLKDNEKKMQKLENDAQRLENDRGDLSKSINKIQKDLDTQKIVEREMLDNMTLREKEQQCKDWDEEIKKTQDELGGLDPSNLERDKRKLKEQQAALEKDKHVLEGRLTGYEDQIQTLRDNLESEMFHDAEKNFQDKMILLKTTEMVTADLDKYYKALDRTIMSHHQKKMDEINKIIRELWRNTYRGNDIETIEIRSDEDEGSGASKARRTYNYRVVMIKGDTPIDMRGRCSAGQKVLASLIIRLALAETFCLNCGILALDEPTTNLDRENIESLACALVDIIRNRVQQKNFQLVVITHDEDFVELLGKSDYVDYFFRVSKNADGHSRLQKLSIQNFSR